MTSPATPSFLNATITEKNQIGKDANWLEMLGRIRNELMGKMMRKIANDQDCILNGKLEMIKK